MRSRFSFEWDVNALAKAFNVNDEDVSAYLTDGRRASFMIERRLVNENRGWKLAQSEGAGYDLADPHGHFWEVRSITKGGVYFTPSNQVGKGRHFDENRFLEKLNSIEGFILSDLVVFPKVEFYKVPKDVVKSWYRAGKIGKNAKVTRSKFILELASDIDVSD